MSRSSTMSAAASLLLASCLAGCAVRGTDVPVGDAATSSAQARLWCEPYLQHPRRDAVTVVWWTEDSEPDSRVAYGAVARDRTAAATDDHVPSMGLWRHEATLQGLEAGAVYTYRVRSGRVFSDVYRFRAAPRRDEDLRLAFLGDGRTDDDAVIARHRRLVTMASRADLIFELGDIVDTATVEHWSRFLRRILTTSDPTDPGARTGSEVPFHFVVGNHEIALLPEGMKEARTDADYYGRPFLGVERFQAVAVNPANRSSDPRWEERYYSLDYGAVTLIVLDANNTSDDRLDNHDFLPDGSTPDWEPGSEQHRWLTRELERAQRESAFTFVLAHPSPYSPGVHGAPDSRIDTQRGHELRVLDPLFRRYGVDALITSHDHLIARCLAGPEGFEGEMSHRDPRNINYFVVGNSGQSSRFAEDGSEQWMSVHGDGRPPFFTQWFYPWAGDDTRCSYLEATVHRLDESTWSATFQVVRDDGRVFDRITFERADPLSGEGGGGT